MKRIIGILMLIGVFAGLFAATAFESGIIVAAFGFGAALIIFGIIILAIHLIA